jgi:hypothetical protein
MSPQGYIVTPSPCHAPAWQGRFSAHRCEHHKGGLFFLSAAQKVFGKLYTLDFRAFLSCGPPAIVAPLAGRLSQQPEHHKSQQRHPKPSSRGLDNAIPTHLPPPPIPAIAVGRLANPARRRSMPDRGKRCPGARLIPMAAALAHNGSSTSDPMLVCKTRNSSPHRCNHRAPGPSGGKPQPQQALCAA